MQLSLAACVAMMFAAGLLLAVNFMLPRDVRPEKCEFMLVPVYGFPFEYARGEPRVPSYKGSAEAWSTSDEPPIPRVTYYPTLWDRDRDDLQTMQERYEQMSRLLEWMHAREYRQALQASWRLPANIAANAAMILAVGFLFEFLRRRRERRAILPP